MRLFPLKARTGIAALTFAARVAIVASTLATASILPASAVSINLGPGKFGDLSQNDPGLAGVCVADNTRYACGPVAAANSLVFLQNQYPQIYGNALIMNGSLVQTATALAGLMNCMACAGGTDINDFSTGKMTWINNNVPGSTSFSLNLTPPDRFPSIDVLAQDLMRGEDTELLIGFYDKTTGARVGGHYVTLFSLTTGADGSRMGFIDPDPNPALAADKAYMVLPNGTIQINLYGPGTANARVEWAIDESPVPGPVVGAGLPGLILASGVLLLLARRRRRTA
jgi:hypothetical protein